MSGCLHFPFGFGGKFIRKFRQKIYSNRILQIVEGKIVNFGKAHRMMQPFFGFYSIVTAETKRVKEKKQGPNEITKKT